MNRILAATYPDAHIELNFSNPLELLVATILSAQSTDKRVNLITPLVFARYPDAAAYAAADRAELEELIKPTGFFRAKTDTLIKLGAALTERFGGSAQAYEGPGDSPRRRPQDRQRGTRQRLRHSRHHVDTHFGRLVRRFGWTTETDPDKVEVAVAALFPQGLDPAVPQRHLARRRRCHARNPACGACPIARAPRSGKERPIRSGRQAGSGAAGMMRRRGRLMPAVAVLVMVLAGCTGSPGPPAGNARRVADRGPTDAGGDSRSCGHEEGGGHR